MAASVEKDGYTAELVADDLEIVYRNPRGRQLKKVPAQLAGAPDLTSLIAVRNTLLAHRTACEERARAWAAAGTCGPLALAEADPEWRRALETAGVPLTASRGEEGLFARTYAGPHGCTLTQLLAEDVIPYRDLLMREDGWEPADLFATGLADEEQDADGRLPFPERVLAAHPHQHGLALEKIRALRRETLEWKYVFKKDMDGVLAGLEETAPALAVTLLDEMADFALEAGTEQEAAAWFGRARRTERNLGRAPDHAWLHARYLRYARAGALSASVLRAWVAELAAGDGVGADTLARFREVVRARNSEQGEMHPQLATDIRKLAKAARLDPDEELASMMEDLLADGGLSLSDTEFWTACCKGRALDALVERRPEAVRDAVLALRPGGYGSGSESQLWRTLLERTGVLAQLAGERPGLPHGTTAAWLTRCVNVRIPTHRAPGPVLYELAEKVASKAAADGVPVEFRQWEHRDWKNKQRVPLDLIDVLLGHGVPVNDPPERLADTKPYDLLLTHRPQLRHLLADERFQREVRAWMRADLDMTVGHGTAADGMSSNRWYNPHETKGWPGATHLYATWVGHEELRAWCERERARLRAGVDFDGFVTLLGRFVHVGGAVDELLKDAEAAREVQAVDVIGLLMPELPVRLERARVEKLVARVEPAYLSQDSGATGDNYVLLREELPELAPGTAWQEASASFHRVTHLLVMAANCLVGQARLVRRLAPPGSEPAQPPAPEQDTSGPALARRLMELAVSDTPPWDGDIDQGSGAAEAGWQRLRPAHYHGHAVVEALRAGLSSGPRTVEELAEYAECPFATDPAGEWRIVEYATPPTALNRWRTLYARPIRTATSAAVAVPQRGTAAGRKRDPVLRVLEYAPDGDFPAAGPLAAAGLEPLRTQVLEPARPGGWFTRFAELYRERGPAPARPALAADLAARIGLSIPEATILLRGGLPSAAHQDVAQEVPLSTGYYGSEKWKVRDKELDQACDALGFLTPAQLRRLYDRLLPEDPERLWTEGPDLDRAVEWWLAEFGEPLPVPHELMPQATKEIAAPKGEHAMSREGGGGSAPQWWPALRRSVLLGRLAMGDGCLTPDPRQASDAGLLDLPRIAAWAAYRTPAGSPPRTAAGAAAARMRAELAAGPGPLRVFSLQRNYLMGAPPSIEPLTAHPAVTVADDETYEIRHVLVDPAHLTGADDPVLQKLDTYLEGLYPSQWLPTPSGLPALADLRLLLSEDFAALGAHLEADRTLPPGWEQHPARSVPHLVTRCAERHGLGEDAAALYLMLLALPDPTDRNVKTWTGWRPARFKEAAAQLAATPLVVRAARSRAGRALFVPGAWHERAAPRLPLEAGKLPLLPQAENRRSATHMAVVPSMPIPRLFERAWERTGA